MRRHWPPKAFRLKTDQNHDKRERYQLTDAHRCPERQRRAGMAIIATSENGVFPLSAGVSHPPFRRQLVDGSHCFDCKAEFKPLIHQPLVPLGQGDAGVAP